VLSWAGLLALRAQVRNQVGGGWRPNVLAVSEMQSHQLLNNYKFLSSLKLRQFFQSPPGNADFYFKDLGLEAVSLPLGPMLRCVACTEIQR
jgi:hypothetical protein